MTKHTLYKCPPECDHPHCPICEGGLALCIVCGGAEGSLPTDCPGYKMSQTQEDNVFNKTLDFINGEWREK